MEGVVIGLTGGIAAGKTSVAEMLRGLGADVYDADAACHRLLEREDDVALGDESGTEMETERNRGEDGSRT